MGEIAMNVRFRFIVLPLSVLALTACASMDERSSVAPRHSGYVQDSEYVAAVEYVAKQRGVDVVWVNPPKLPADDED